MKKKIQKNAEMPNPFHERNADIVWQEQLQNSQPVSREEIIRRLGGNLHQKESPENKG